MFYKNYIVYYNVYCYYCDLFIETYVYTKFRLDWLFVSDLRGHLCPYRNVLPEAVCCCFTRTTLFTNMPIPWSLWISICTQSFISQLPLVIEIRLSKLKKKKKKKKKNNNKEKMKNCENELLQF